MRLRLAAVGLVVALPALYIGGAVWRSWEVSMLALTWVALICLALLWPGR